MGILAASEIIELGTLGISSTSIVYDLDVGVVTALIMTHGTKEPSHSLLRLPCSLWRDGLPLGLLLRDPGFTG